MCQLMQMTKSLCMSMLQQQKLREKREQQV